MKKIVIIALAVLVSASFNTVSAGKKKDKAEKQKTIVLASRADSLSYMLGMVQTQGMKEYLHDRLSVDTAACLNDFLRGLREAVDAGTDKSKTAYIAGMQIGHQIATQMINGINNDLYGQSSTKSISLPLFMEGFVAATAGQPTLATMEEANEKARQLMDIEKEETALREYGDNKVAGEKFLAENVTKDSIRVLDCGVQYKVLVEGTGAIPTAQQKVRVNYEGRLLDGTVFDSSFKRNRPNEFRCDQVIKGWTEVLTHMPVGSTWEVYIPQELAYGSRKVGNDITPFSMLIFKIELLDIVE